MRAMVGAIAAALVWGSGGCTPTGGSKCQKLVLEDTTELFVSGKLVMAKSKGDTVPKPYSTCLTFYAARDTVPKP